MKRAKLIHLVDLIFLIQLALVVCSGFIMYSNHDAASSLLRSVHDKAEVLLLVFFSAHILLNWRWILFTTRKYCRRKKEVKEGEVIEANYMSID